MDLPEYVGKLELWILTPSGQFSIPVPAFSFLLICRPAKKEIQMIVHTEFQASYQALLNVLEFILFVLHQTNVH